MLLSYRRLVSLVAAGIMKDVKPNAINGASIDVHLSRRFLFESQECGRPGGCYADLSAGEVPKFEIYDCPDGRKVSIFPKAFVLASTEETFNLPNNIAALFVMKSSLARGGLDQMNAAWCSPGWTGSSLTLELMNVTEHHTLMLAPGMPIGQMVFFECEHVPDFISYRNRGKFNDNNTVTASSDKSSA